MGWSAMNMTARVVRRTCGLSNYIAIHINLLVDLIGLGQGVGCAGRDGGWEGIVGVSSLERAYGKRSTNKTDR
jgi:hypothetical protein